MTTVNDLWPSDGSKIETPSAPMPEPVNPPSSEEPKKKCFPNNERPSREKVACVGCYKSTWHTMQPKPGDHQNQPKRLRCFCTVMHVLTYDSGDQNLTPIDECYPPLD